MFDKSARILSRSKFWVILGVSIIFAIVSLWIEGLAPLYQRLGIARSIEVPVCVCIGLNDPGNGSSPDEEVDLDPSINDYDKFGWVLKKPDQRTILVKFSTQEQLYHYLTTTNSKMCLATDISSACMRGHILLTEVIDGKQRTIDYGGPACELATPKPFEWITPDVKVNNCTLPNGQNATHPSPATPRSSP